MMKTPFCPAGIFPRNGEEAGALWGIGSPRKVFFTFHFSLFTYQGSFPLHKPVCLLHLLMEAFASVHVDVWSDRVLEIVEKLSEQFL